MDSPAMLVLAATALVAALSWAIWRFFERPVQKQMKAALTHAAELATPLAGRVRATMVRARAT